MKVILNDKPLSQYIGRKGWIENDGWNFSHGTFEVVGVDEAMNILIIEHSDKTSSGGYWADFIIKRLNKETGVKTK